MYTIVEANEAQAEKIFKKHLRFPVSRLKYSYDTDDGIGFFSCYTLTDWKIECQDRNGEPMFVEFTKYTSDIRYDISYPEKINEKLYNRLKKLVQKARNRFWAGGQI